MSDPFPPADSAASPDTGPRGYPLLAWIVIAGLVAFVIFRTTTSIKQRKTRLDLLGFQIQARVLVGFGELMEKQEGPEGIFAQAKALDRGSYDQRLRFVIVALELAGRKEAEARLERLRGLAKEHKLKLSDEQKDLTESIEQHITQKPRFGQPDELTAEEKRQVLDEMGWFGELLFPETRPAALAAARRAMYATVGTLGLLFLLAVCGFFVLILLIVLRVKGWIPSRIGEDSPSGLYAETFAFWMLLWVGVGYLGRWIPRTDYALLVNGLLSFVTLGVALLWPVVRGRAWADVKRDIGFTFGPTPFREIGYGFVCYICALPLVVGGLFAVQLLIRIQQQMQGPAPVFGPSGDPTHPLIQSVSEGGWGVLFQVYFAAAVVAPVAEEIIFRGVLYRHLRGVVGIVLGMVLVAFVFAIIHPQGWVGVPVLMALAVSFNCFREWRGSLVPAMIAHGLNNGLITTMLIIATR